MSSTLRAAASLASLKLLGEVETLRKLHASMPAGMPQERQTLRFSADSIEALAYQLAHEADKSGPMNSELVRAMLAAVGVISLALLTGVGEGIGSDLYEDLRSSNEHVQSLCIEVEQTMPHDWGSYFADELRRRGMPHSYAAERLGVSSSTLSRWVANTSRPNSANQKKIQELLAAH